MALLQVWSNGTTVLFNKKDDPGNKHNYPDFKETKDHTTSYKQCAALSRYLYPWLCWLISGVGLFCGLLEMFKMRAGNYLPSYIFCNPGQCVLVVESDTLNRSCNHRGTPGRSLQELILAVGN